MRPLPTSTGRIVPEHTSSMSERMVGSPVREPVAMRASAFLGRAIDPPDPGRVPPKDLLQLLLPETDHPQLLLLDAG